MNFMLVAFVMLAPVVRAENTIDFSKSTNLKAVYDAGLRPWRVRQDEISDLLVTEQQVRIIAPNGKSFSMSLEIGNFSVLAENQLNTADFLSHPTSLPDALQMAKEICQSLEVSITHGDGMGSMDEKASEFSSLGSKTPVPQFWNGQSEINGIRYSVTLHPLFAYKETLAKVYVRLDFYQRGKPMKFLTEPIKPPPGYEHLSLEPPPRDPNRKPFPNPKDSFENTAKRVEAAKVAEGRAPALPDAPSAHPSSAPLNPPSTVQTALPTPMPWPWIIGAIFLMALVGLIFKILRKKI